MLTLFCRWPAAAAANVGAANVTAVLAWDVTAMVLGLAQPTAPRHSARSSPWAAKKVRSHKNRQTNCSAAAAVLIWTALLRRCTCKASKSLQQCHGWQARSAYLHMIHFGGRGYVSCAMRRSTHKSCRSPAMSHPVLLLLPHIFTYCSHRKRQGCCSRHLHFRHRRKLPPRQCQLQHRLHLLPHHMRWSPSPNPKPQPITKP
jgi:hypothetical protein